MRDKFATGYVGVRGPYERLRQRVRRTGLYPSIEYYFQATWQENGCKRKAQFSINAHGYRQALNLAIAARSQAEEGRPI